MQRPFNTSHLGGPQIESDLRAAGWRPAGIHPAATRLRAPARDREPQPAGTAVAAPADFGSVWQPGPGVAHGQLGQTRQARQPRSVRTGARQGWCADRITRAQHCVRPDRTGRRPGAERRVRRLVQPMARVRDEGIARPGRSRRRPSPTGSTSPAARSAATPRTACPRGCAPRRSRSARRPPRPDPRLTCGR